VVARPNGGRGSGRAELRQVGDVRLGVVSEGIGPPFVLHSGGGGLEDYLAPVAALVDDLVTVVRFDPRGCGRSEHVGPYDVTTLLRDLDTLRETLGHERWLVGGHSAGADLALAYALEHPERTSGLVLISGTGIQDDRQWHAAYERGRDAGRDPLPPLRTPPNLEVNGELNASWRRYIKQPRLLRRIADLQVPTLAVVGAEDVRPSWPVEQLAELLPDASFVRIDGAGHMPWTTHAGELGAALRSFLAAHTNRPGAE
jgi:proline iminopeptidase